MIQLGFSTGVLHKHQSAKEALYTIKKAGCNVVELGFVRLERLRHGWLDEITRDDLHDFAYVSMHAPKFSYGQDGESTDILKKIRNFYIPAQNPARKRGDEAKTRIFPSWYNEKIWQNISGTITAYTCVITTLFFRPNTASISSIPASSRI